MRTRGRSVPTLESLEGRNAPGVVFNLDTTGDPSGFLDDPARRAALWAVLGEVSPRLSDPSNSVAVFDIHARVEALPPGVLGEAVPYHFASSGLPDTADIVFSSNVSDPAGVARVAWHELGHALGLHHAPAGLGSAGRPVTMTPYGTGHYTPYDWQSLRDAGWAVSPAPPSFSLGVAGHVKTFDADGAEALSFLPYTGYSGRVGVRTLEGGVVLTAASDGRGGLHQKSFDAHGNELSSTLSPGDLPPQPAEGGTTDEGGGVLRVGDYTLVPYEGYRGLLRT